MADTEEDKARKLLEKEQKIAIIKEKLRRKAKTVVDNDEQRIPVELVRRKVSSLVVRKPDRLFGNRFERGSFNFIVGHGEVGKGMVSMDIVSRLSTGEPFPGEGNTWRPPMKVLICSVEDSDNEIAGRLAAAKANTDNIELLTGPSVLRGGLEMPSAMKLDSDAGPLVKLARDENFGAIFIETMVEHFGDRDGKKQISTNSEAEVRGALAPFRAVCREANIYGWALIHPRKSSSGDVQDLISGSAAFYNVPRMTMYVFKDPTDDSRSPRRLLCCGKSNNLAMRPETYRFNIESHRDNPVFGHVVWGVEGKTLEDERGVEEVLRDLQDKSKTRRDTAVVKAEEFLRKTLAQGQKTPGQIKELGEAQGIAWRAIERAKKNMALVSIRENAFGGGVVGWVFPEEEM